MLYCRLLRRKRYRKELKKAKGKSSKFEVIAIYIVVNNQNNLLRFYSISTDKIYELGIPSLLSFKESYKIKWFQDHGRKKHHAFLFIIVIGTPDTTELTNLPSTSTLRPDAIYNNVTQSQQHDTSSAHIYEKLNWINDDMKERFFYSGSFTFIN